MMQQLLYYGKSINLLNQVNYTRTDSGNPQPLDLGASPKLASTHRQQKRSHYRQRSILH